MSMLRVIYQKDFCIGLFLIIHTNSSIFNPLRVNDSHEVNESYKIADKKNNEIIQKSFKYIY